MSVALRAELVAGDAVRIERLVAATGAFNPEEIAIARELVDERLRRGEASGYRFALAEAGDELAGYACFGAVPATVSSHHLYWIAVAPGWQRRGVATTLLASVVRRVRESGGERLYAETSTRPAYATTNAFYRDRGFRLVATLPEHFAPGDGKAIYELAV